MDRQLEFIKKIKEFGEKKLALNFDGSFETLAENGFSCNWVYASHRDRIRSVFRNNAPFEFYGDPDEASKRYEHLKKKGHDAYLYHAEAHGGRECPVTKELLTSPGARQCYVVIHEGWHSTCRVNKYRFTYPYEESTGRVVGLFGAIEFAKETGDEALMKACIDQEAAWSLFADFVNESDALVTQAAEDNAPEQRLSEIKRDLTQQARRICEKMPDAWERSELGKEINNAFILRYRSYTAHYSLAKSMFMEDRDLKKAMDRFLKRAPALNMMREDGAR